MSAKSIQALREQHAQEVTAAKHILAEMGDKVWTKEQQAKFDTHTENSELIAGQIQAYERLQQEAVEDDFKDIDNFKAEKGQKTQAQQAVDIFFRKSDKQMNAQEAALIYNTMSTTTGSEGGFTVQSEVASQLIEKLKDYGAMRREASQMTTASGNPLSYPTTDGTSEEGEIVAENTSAAEADIVFGTLGLNVYKFGSKVIAIPIELLQDSTIDVQALIFNRCASRIGRIQNRLFTVGTGTDQPLGIVPAASVGKTGATGQTVLITYDDLVDVEESLDVAYTDYGSGKPCWMFGQTLRKTIRKIKDTAGRPVWTPSYDAGISGGMSAQLMGHDVCVNNNMAVPAANAKSLAFGDLRSYMIRDALQVSLFRFDDSAYVKKGQIGFMAWSRSGGTLLDVNSVRLYQHSAT